MFGWPVGTAQKLACRGQIKPPNQVDCFQSVPLA